ncbi:MAG: hypothetical protein LC135_02770 [Phycisphaerae bacterium]|nr:hypothetical protein [Phycisphaerae bacterium]MCZ2398778.1 hypothetical protein [Phycisphaerae bacterium]NUQ49271.1 hypothetical protein [Phycisphaerae bacterium]
MNRSVNMATGLLCALAAAAAAQAAILTFELSVEFSGATPPAGAAPWLTATFDDGGSPGSVDLTLATTNLVSNEFVFRWMFNLDPVLDPTSLSFSAPSKTGAFTDPVINTGVDSFMADGDGKFDIEVVFSNAGGPANRFGAGDSVKYTITGIPGLTAASFDFLSAPAGGHGPFPTAAHVGGIGANDDESGWITVPEPSTGLAGLLILCAALARRRP